MPLGDPKIAKNGITSGRADKAKVSHGMASSKLVSVTWVHFRTRACRDT